MNIDSGAFAVADHESVCRFTKCKMVDPAWRGKIQNIVLIFNKNVDIGISIKTKVTDYKSFLKVSKLKKKDSYGILDWLFLMLIIRQWIFVCSDPKNPCIKNFVAKSAICNPPS